MSYSNPVIKKKRITKDEILSMVKQDSLPDVIIINETTSEVNIKSKNFVSVEIEFLDVLLQEKNNTTLEFRNNIGILFLMFPYIDFSTNYLLINENIALSASNFSELIGFSSRTVKNTLNNLIELEVLVLQENTNKKIKGKNIYVVNPYFIRKKTKYNTLTTSVFQNKIKNTFPKNHSKSIIENRPNI